MINAIPTKYAGVQFRSRLEAKWASFFDLLGWKWDYEPIDLNGYIPDFIVRRPMMSSEDIPGLNDPFLIEVKPFVHWPCSVLGCTTCPSSHGRNNVDSDARSMMDEAIIKIQRSGWTKNAVIVGATMAPVGQLGVPRFGTAVDVMHGHDLWFYTDTVVTKCRRCPVHLAQPDIDSVGIIHCGTKPTLPIDPVSLWREAGNRVQWRGQECNRKPITPPRRKDL